MPFCPVDISLLPISPTLGMGYIKPKENSAYNLAFPWILGFLASVLPFLHLLDSSNFFLDVISKILICT